MRDPDKMAKKFILNGHDYLKKKISKNKVNWAQWNWQIMKIKVESLHGDEIIQYKNELAHLRLKVFRDYPYLYDGTIEYEEAYLETLIESPESILVVALDHEKVIGASTGMPLKDETEEIKRPWLEKGEDIDIVFYFSESVLLKEYRGQGIGVRFFEERERWARHLGYKIATFCGVIRDKEDPHKPENYTTLDRFWKNRGYQKKEGFICTMSWKQIDEPQESAKKLQFWYKDIKA